MKETFKQKIEKAYSFSGESIVIGTSMLEGEPIPNNHVRIPLRMMNRHGLISGATGTGKTKTAQILAEQLANQGVPSLIMDMKTDLSGIGAAGESNDHIKWRHGQIGVPYQPAASSIEFLSLSDEPGARLRSTITEFGPILLSKIMGLNDTQQSVLTVLVKYADDHKIPLIDLEDLKDLLRFATNEGKDKLKQEYGFISSASVGAIMRRVVELEQQEVDHIFGEPSFEVFDLLQKDAEGEGIVHVVRLADIQSKPKLFSTFMLQLLGEIYTLFPEEGDMEKPKLCIFIDEAHLIFDEASDVLLDQIEMIVKLIRSKGVGIFFITQNPVDIPSSVLSQLGLKIQHALRAFTAKDRKAIKMVAQNYPISDFYNIEEELTSLGIGEALVTALDEDGRPTDLVRTLLIAPESRMDILNEEEIAKIVSNSKLIDKYKEKRDRQEAEEALKSKMEEAQSEEKQAELKRIEDQVKDEKGSGGWMEFIGNALNTTAGRQVSRTIARELTRGLLGILGGKK